MASQYDFIVVGAGASGCAVASRIAHSSSKPSVVLLEAGAPYEHDGYLAAEERFNVAFDTNSFPNWGYKTTAQRQLDGQEVDYSRGKGLGGTTSINFCGWVVGSRDEFDEWANLVGDNSFSWPAVKRCLDKVTRLHSDIPHPELKKYINPRIEDHSVSGVIDLTYGGPWLPDTLNIFVAAEQIGMPLNKDINAGDPIGIGMGSVNCYGAKRVTAAAAYLKDAPQNLTVVSGALVAKIILEGKRAKGVETVDGLTFTARSEVILSGGALNSPQILLLSGIGPREELQKHNIPVRHELPMVGENLRDHCYSSVGIVVKHGPDFLEESTSLTPSPMAFLKSAAAMASSEYSQLSLQVQRHLQAPTVPNFEIATRHDHLPPPYLCYVANPEVSFVGAICILENPQSSGTVKLRSADPSDTPVIDPRFLTHPFDRRVIIDGMRRTLQLLKAPVYAEKTVEVLGPKDESDEAIWEHVRCNFGSSWHMCCTVRMGKESDSACVDSSFRVLGIEGLRVVDLSVCPFVPSNHTQSTAYVLGEIAAEKLIVEHSLNVLNNGLVGHL